MKRKRIFRSWGAAETACSAGRAALKAYQEEVNRLIAREMRLKEELEKAGKTVSDLTRINEEAVEKDKEEIKILRTSCVALQKELGKQVILKHAAQSQLAVRRDDMPTIPFTINF